MRLRHWDPWCGGALVNSPHLQDVTHSLHGCMHYCSFFQMNGHWSSKKRIWLLSFMVYLKFACWLKQQPATWLTLCKGKLNLHLPERKRLCASEGSQAPVRFQFYPSAWDQPQRRAGLWSGWVQEQGGKNWSWDTIHFRFMRDRTEWTHISVWPDLLWQPVTFPGFIYT